LWLADIAPACDQAWAMHHMTWLSSTEAARLARMHRPARRAQLLAGHVLLRRLLAALTGTPAQAVSIAADAEGRPAVSAPQGWRSSLAHSGRWVAALVDAADAAVGVDIEFRKPQRDIRAIVRAACGIEAGSADEAYALWAQREAEYKAGHSGGEVWVASWDDHVLAVCGRAVPDVAAVTLDDAEPVRTLPLAWTARPRLPARLWMQ
jgi:phosphopantetheinyl transferase